MLHLGHLRSDQLGRVLLLAAVLLPLLPLLHLLVVVLHVETGTKQQHAVVVDQKISRASEWH